MTHVLPPTTPDDDTAMEAHLEELLADLSPDEVEEIAALAEAMHANPDEGGSMS